MDISWLQFLNVNAEALFLTLNQTSQPLTLSLLSVNVQSQLSISSFVLLAYFLLAVLSKRSSFLMAFFVSWMIFELSIFDPLSEASLYLITFSIYSYVIFDIERNRRATVACGILLTLSLILAYDAYFYGEFGVYGAHKTVIYNNIAYLATCAHTCFICTLVPVERIRNHLRSFIDSISHIAVNSDYMLIYWYNVSKATNQKTL